MHPIIPGARNAVDSFMKRVLLALALLTIACDPSMGIYQAKANRDGPDSDLVTISVKNTRHLTGETWYMAGEDKVTVTNALDIPITIMNIELLANGRTYKNIPENTAKEYRFPLIIKAGRSEALHFWFDLKDSVYFTFKDPAELRVYYRNGGSESVVSAFIVAGP